MYINKHTRIYGYIHVHVFYVNTHAHIYVYMHVCVSTHASLYVSDANVYIRECIYTHISRVHMCFYIYLYMRFLPSIRSHTNILYSHTYIPCHTNIHSLYYCLYYCLYYYSHTYIPCHTNILTHIYTPPPHTCLRTDLRVSSFCPCMCP